MSRQPSQRHLLERIGLHSIQGRLSAIAVLSIALTAFGIALAGYRFTSNFEQQRYQAHFALLARQLAANAELGVLLADQRLLASLADNLLAIDDIVEVVIVDSRDQLLLRRGRPANGNDLETVRALVLATSMNAADNPFVADSAPDTGADPIAEVRLRYSLLSLRQLQHRLALGFAVISLSLAIVPAVFYWRLSRAIRAPLKDLLQIARQVSQGRFDVRASGGTLLETRTLSVAINDMLDALQEQRRQLAQANEAIARQQVLAEVGKFSLTVAHEIKNPLAIMHGSLSLLRQQPEPAIELKQRLHHYIDDEIRRVNSLVEDFLLFARPRPPALQRHSVAGLCASLQQRLHLLQPGLQIHCQPADNALHCDQALLERALHNLVRNAVEVASSPAAVEVHISISDSQLRLCVTDDGPGIAPAERERIFEPFFTTKAKGTGLGLAIARSVAQAQGGSLDCQASPPGGGARFVLQIPLDTPADGSAVAVAP
ncbi:MAG: ATP-binding protein [Desulfuromonas sp.]|nr:ATP-binding protein [Desulfuromonas thiophila]